MTMGELRHLIASFKRHYNLLSDDIIACYDTSIWALFGSSNDLQDICDLHYVTVSVSAAQFKRLEEQLGETYMCEHPVSDVQCLKLSGGRLYVLSEQRLNNKDITWSKRTRCYTPVARILWNKFEAIASSELSTEDQIRYANTALNNMKTHSKKRYNQ